MEAQRPPQAVAGAQVQRAGAVLRCQARAVAREAPAGGKWAGGRAALCPALGPWGPGPLVPGDRESELDPRRLGGARPGAALRVEGGALRRSLRPPPPPQFYAETLIRDWRRFPVPFHLRYGKRPKVKDSLPLYSLYRYVLNPGETLGSFVQNRMKYFIFFFSLEVEGRTVVTLHISAH